MDLVSFLTSKVSPLSAISGLQISANNLSGKIPDSMGSLTSLDFGIWLESNRLTGKIPNALASLTQCQRFLFRANRLSGT